ncbi:hypothetical protein HYALB_00012403 [Hymenoscyphus albidus]|uniref:Uncharacterized protein n=1 Tax=Hymenoscyphus albidus TaxID=595503 RepID=A0A9N9LWA4_9HELO|nr:hypothetical protein HYALB_00012403 [Hymenoscyphus albidus]
MWSNTLAAVLLISRVSAGVAGSFNVLGGRGNSIEDSARRYVDSIVEPLERRAPVGPGMSQAAWDASTEKACTLSLEALNGQATNPSGMAVCYNLPMLDNQTGVFQADLRLFMVGPPTGPFANIAAQNVNVGLAYNGATVSAVNKGTGLKKRVDVGVSIISWPKHKRQAPIPILTQQYAFVGQINQQLLKVNMGTENLQKILVPSVTLSATDALGKPVNTTLSSSEATFVNGVFAQSVAPSRSQLAPPLQTLVPEKGTLFVLPGTKFEIFPIGFVITSTWAVLFISTIAYGTYGRLQFREQYRRRTARATKGATARI